MKIKIYTKQMVMRMGSGWLNPNEANATYAKYLQSQIAADLRKTYPDAEIDVNVEASTDAGYDEPMSAWVDDTSKAHQVESIVKKTISKAWGDWVDSEEAEAFLPDNQK